MLKEVRCPACRRVTALEGNPFRPFCSERCRLHDLGNWALERYRIEGQAVDVAADDGEDDADQKR